ncbi:MAG: N-formylglutamate deformylase [Maricaulaceae bacterium]
MKVVEITRGDSPIILAMPHTGTYVPPDIWDDLNPLGQTLEDTDWHVHKLYEGLLSDVTSVRATFHRYVIDANRDPSGASLYPGQNTTQLCPTTDFEARHLYHDGKAPSDVQIEQRRLDFHAPYHAALTAEIARVKDLHGMAILYDCHSIQSRKPFLFQGILPDFNIGTNDGKTCHPILQTAVSGICADCSPMSFVVNGRFKGGWTTRHYGRPQDRVHAVQMELAQSTYMDEQAPWAYNSEKASHIRLHLKNILQTLEQFAKEI